MMKFIYVVMTFLLFSCATKVKETKVNSMPLTKAVMIDKVLSALNIDESQTGAIIAETSPNNANETIVVVPVVVNESEDEDEEVYELDSHIVIVDHKTGKITHKFFETSKTSGWVSDAILISQIAIDTTSYQLNKKGKQAFGVTISFRNMSQPNPYNAKYISLFTKQEDKLVKIIDSHSVYESSGVVNVNMDTCYADIKDVDNLLSMSNTFTKGYYDIVSAKTVTQHLFKLDENGECNPVEKVLQTSIKVLEFNGKMYDQKKPIELAVIDSVSVKEIKRYVDEKKLNIFDYYKKEHIDEVEIWSDKMFGRCCTEADLSYSELLFFDIKANREYEKYSYLNLTDQRYQFSYAFKENDSIEITIQLDRKNKWHQAQTNLSVDEVLKMNDTLLSPFKLSVVNGYAKTAKTFKENARVKEIDVFLNGEYKGSVTLLDTPLVQQFKLDFTFFKNDVVKLIPTGFYKGSKYDDVCISEIQSSLSQITHHSINKKYKVRLLWKRGNQ